MVWIALFSREIGEAIRWLTTTGSSSAEVREQLREGREFERRQRDLIEQRSREAREAAAQREEDRRGKAENAADRPHDITVR
jgi:hypothetical protein